MTVCAMRVFPTAMQRCRNLISRDGQRISPVGRRGIAQKVVQYPARLLCRSCACGDRCIAWRTIGDGGERRSREARQAIAASPPFLRHVSRAFLCATRDPASRAGIRLSSPRASKRDRRAGLYIRAARRHSRRVMRPANERMHERVSRCPVTAIRA